MDFQRVLQGQMQAYGQALGGGKPLSGSLEQLIERQVAAGLVMQTAMAQQARQMGIVIGDDEILKILQENQAFHDPEKKRFSPAIYARVLELNNLKASQYEKSIRTELAGQRLRHLIETSVVVSDKEVMDNQRIQAQKLKLDVAIFTPASIAKSGQLKITPEKLKEYYESHKGEFLSPARRQATVASISQIDIENKAAVSEAEIKNYFDSQVASSNDKKWTTPYAHAYHILISDTTKAGLQQAESIKAQITTDGKKSSVLEAFQQAAAVKSEDYSNASKGGDLGYFDEKTMVKPFADAVFRAGNSRNVIGPVKTDFGFHLIYVADSTGAFKTLEARKKQIAYELKKQKAAEEMDRLNKSLADLMKKNSKGTADELKTLGFKIVETQPIDMQSRSPDVPYLVLQEVMQGEVGKWSEPKALQGSLFVFRVNEEIKPVPQTFAEAEATVRLKLQNAEAEALVKASYDALTSGKAKWADLSKSGAELKSAQDFKPFAGSQVPGAADSELVLKGAQGLSQSSPYAGPITSEGKWVILKGSDFSAPNATVKPEDFAKLKEDLLTKKRMQVLNSYMDKVVKEARIPESFRKKYNL